MPSSISERLKALGVRIGAQEVKPSPTPTSSDPELEKTLGGRLVETHHGEAFIVEQRHPIGERYGQTQLLLSEPLDVLADWAGDPRLRDVPAEGFSFLDTETTGLSGGTGTYAFLIGVGRFIGAEFVLQQLFMRDPSDEIAQIAALEAFLAPVQALVTFNGKSFDAPLLNTRFLMQGLISPLPALAHVDLLHLARRLWRDRLPSRALGDLEVQILGSLRSGEDIPGWMIPEIYFNFLRDHDPAPLQSVLYHNAMDVLSLVALLNHTAGLLNDPFERGGRYGVDLIALGKLFEDLGRREAATDLYIHGLEHEDALSERLPEGALLQALGRLAMIHKHEHNLSQAIELWTRAADHRHLGAHVELAKAYEHELKDLEAARQWTEAAILLVESDPGERLLAYQKSQWLDELNRRRRRLLVKLSRGE